MNRISVKSSSLVSVRYDEKLEVLEIEFKENRVYRYFKFPKSVYTALMAAPSVGAFHAANIKDKYEFDQL